MLHPMSAAIVVLLATASSAVSQAPSGEVSKETFDKLQALARNAIKKESFVVTSAEVWTGDQMVEIIPPRAFLGEHKTDRHTVLFKYLVRVELVKKNPYPRADPNKWVSAVTKAANLDESLAEVNKAPEAEAAEAALDRRLDKQVFEVYRKFGKADGKDVWVVEKSTRVEVDFVTVPVDARIFMMSVWEFEVLMARGADADAALRSRVVTPRVKNENFAGDVYYLLEKKGVLDGEKKQIRIAKSGRLELP
jgi:hypothetical protein